MTRINIITKLQLLVCLPILITGCAAINISPDIPVILSTTQIVGITGGKVEDPTGAEVIIPAGALSKSVNIQIGEYKNPPTWANTVGNTYFFGPSGIKFNKPVTVTLPFDPDALAEGLELSEIHLLRYDDMTRTWSALESSIDVVEKTISGQTSKFSGFAPGILEDLPLVILSFTADTNVVIAGESVDLSWLTAGATRLSIDQGVGVVTGQNSVTVTPTQTTTYTLTARNATLTGTISLTINLVDPVPMTTIQITGPKPTDLAKTYRSYQKLGYKYRIVCEEPCGIDEKLIYSRYSGFKPAKDQLINLFGIDILEEYSPFDIHMESDSWCGSYDPNLAAGFSGRYHLGVGPTTGSGGSYGCFFDIDKEENILPDTLIKISEQLLYVHEYAHVIFFGRHRRSYEDVVKAASFYISWVPPITNACDPMMKFKWSGKLIYELCQQNGFSFTDLAPTLQQLDSLYQSGQGYNGWRTSVYQYREILNRHLGSDTINAFLDAGLYPASVGDDTVLQLGGGNHSLIRGHIYLSLPPLAVLGKTPIKIEKLSSTLAHPNFNFSMAHDIMPKDQIHSQARYSRFLKPVKITIRYDPNLLKQGIDERSLRLFRINNAEDAWEKIPGSLVDVKLKEVTGYIDDLGVYAIMPEELPEILIIKPGDNAMFVDSESIELEATVRENGENLEDPLVIWSEDQPYPEGRIIGRGRISLTRFAAGVYTIYATYLGSEIVSDYTIITVMPPTQ